jgi:ribonuclease HI
LRVVIYTDGSSRGNPGPGGYGIVLESGSYRKELSEGFRTTTNNRMELLAAIEGMKALRKRGMEVIVVSDSKYVVDAVNKGWLFGWEKKNYKDKKNVDLWIEFLKYYREIKPKMKWVKGHNNHPQNERCDTLAVEASKRPDLKVDFGFEKEMKQTKD